MFLLLLLNKLSPRRRVVSGVVCTVAGILWVAAAELAAPGLAIHGAVLAVSGAIVWISGAVARRKAARTDARATAAGYAEGR